MPGTTVDVTTGSTIVFGTSGFTSEIMSFTWSGIAREPIDTSHLGTAAASSNEFGNRTFIPGRLIDPGEATLERHFDPDQDIPIGAVAETITITFPLVTGDTTAANWAGSGFATAFDVTGPLDEKMTATMTVKFSGNITMTDAT